LIRHASIYEPQTGDQGWRVLIMRRWPRGVARSRVDTWLKEAAPSTELLNAYHHEGLSWEAFDRQYRAEMQQRPAVLEQLRQMERQHGTITLLCFERIPPHAHCHRTILAELLS
jgi:uncharacterized protein YeaO (DUF488 family)